MIRQIYSLGVGFLDTELAQVVRNIIANERNLRIIQQALLEPVFGTVCNNLNNNEEQIINEIVLRMEQEIGNQGPITFPLEVHEIQKLMLKDIGIPEEACKSIQLEIALMKLHKLRFARGPTDKAELGDFVLHTEYIAPNRFTGLSNFFQIKRIRDEMARVKVDMKQIRFWVCPTKMRYWDWERDYTIDLAKFQRWGECCHYWFIHSSKQAHGKIVNNLLRNSRSWSPIDSAIPFLMTRRIIIHHLTGIRFSQQPLYSEGPAMEIRNLYLTNSFIFCSSMLELLAIHGEAGLCSKHATALTTKTIDLMKNSKQVFVPLQPGGVRFIDSVLLRHGIDPDLLRSIIKAGAGLAPEKEAEKAGAIAILVRVRVGGEEVRSEQEISPT